MLPLLNQALQYAAAGAAEHRSLSCVRLCEMLMYTVMGRPGAAAGAGAPAGRARGGACRQGPLQRPAVPAASICSAPLPQPPCPGWAPACAVRLSASLFATVGAGGDERKAALNAMGQAFPSQKKIQAITDWVEPAAEVVAADRCGTAMAGQRSQPTSLQHGACQGARRALRRLSAPAGWPGVLQVAIRGA